MNITKIAIGQRIIFDAPRVTEFYGLTGYIKRHNGKYCIGKIFSTMDKYKDSIDEAITLYESSSLQEAEKFEIRTKDDKEEIELHVKPMVLKLDDIFVKSIEILKDTLKKLKITGFFSETVSKDKEDHSYLSLNNATLVPHVRYRMDPVGVNEMQEFLGFSVLGDGFIDDQVITVQTLLDLIRSVSGDEVELVTSKKKDSSYRFGIYRNNDIAKTKIEDEGFKFL